MIAKDFTKSPPSHFNNLFSQLKAFADILSPYQVENTGPIINYMNYYIISKVLKVLNDSLLWCLTIPCSYKLQRHVWLLLEFPAGPSSHSVPKCLIKYS